MEETKNSNRFLILTLIIVLILFFVQSFYLFHLKSAIKAIQEPKAQSKVQPMHSFRVSNPSPGDPFGTAGLPQMDEWDPFMEMERMQDFMNRMFRDSFRRAGTMGAMTEMPHSIFEPDLDIQDAGDSYVVKMDLPGLDKDKIKVDVTDYGLTVSGERKVENESQNQNFYTMERSYGSFSRQIPLPADADAANMTAKYENGVLTVQVQKLKKEADPKQQKTVPIQ